MKPFDLEKAKAGAPLVTRNGRKAEFIGYVERAIEGYKLIMFVDGFVSPLFYESNGMVNGMYRADNDLFMEPIMITKYANLVNDDVKSYRMYYEEDVAKRMANNDTYDYLAIAVPVQVDIS